MILAVPYLWMLLFFSVPCLIIAAMSLALAATASPPFEFLPDWPFASLENFAYILSDSLYVRAYIVSAINAATATAFCLALGYPMALAIARTSRSFGGTDSSNFSAAHSFTAPVTPSAESPP